VSFIRTAVISAWRGIARRPVLAWGGAGAVVLAAAAGGAVAATSGGGGAPASGHTVPGHTAPGHTAPSRAAALPVVAIGTFTGRRPWQIVFSADGGNIVTGIRWLSWTGAGAIGRGVSGIESCVPDCAQGTVRYVPTTIRLSGPVNGRFTVLGETRAGQVTTMRWPAHWPLDASQTASRPPGDPSAGVPI
jgi:hypothetical protein